MKKLIQAVHKIHIREIQHCPPIETEPETAIAKYIKKKMKEAFNAGIAYKTSGIYPDLYSPDFEKWFRENFS